MQERYEAIFEQRSQGRAYGATVSILLWSLGTGSVQRRFSDILSWKFDLKWIQFVQLQYETSLSYFRNLKKKNVGSKKQE